MLDAHEELVQLLDAATTWSAYAENQLAAAVTLTNAGLDAARVLRAVQEARHAAQLVLRHCSEYEAVFAAPPPAPAVALGDAVSLEEE